MAMSNQDYLRVLESLGRRTFPVAEEEEPESDMPMASPEPVVDPFSRVLNQIAKQQYAPSRAPAAEDAEVSASPIIINQTPELKEIEQRTKTTPIKSDAIKKLNERIAQLRSELPAMEQAAGVSRGQIEAKAEERLRAAGAVPPKFEYSPEAQQEMSAIEQQVQQAMAESPAARKEIPAWEQALVAFGPAAAGLAIGALTKEPGMAAGGLGYGAAAGGEALEQQRETLDKRYEEELNRLNDRKKTIIQLGKERIKSIAGPEKETYAARVKALSEATAAQYARIRADAEANLKDDPANIKLQARLDEIKKAEAELAQTMGKTGEISEMERKETVPPGKEAKKGLKDIEREERAQDYLGFGFGADPNRAPPTASQQKEAGQIVGGYGKFESAINNAIEYLKKGVFKLPYGQIREEQKQAIMQVFVQVKNSTTEGGFGQALTGNERQMANAIVPEGLKGEELFKHLFNDKSLMKRLLNLKQASKDRVLGAVYPLHYTFIGKKAGAPQPTTTKPEQAPKMAAPKSVGALPSDERKKRIEELRKRLGK